MVPEKQIIIALTASLLCACNSTIIAPVDNRQTAQAYRPAPVNYYAPEPVTRGFHQVVVGDTLYSIAWRYGLDYRDVAFWNGITAGYVIHPGDRLRLLPPDSSSSSPDNAKVATVPDTPPIQTAPPSLPPPRPTGPSSTVTSPDNSQVNAESVLMKNDIEWQWPAFGEIVRSNTPIAQKGLDVSGSEGQEIYAAADGIVVYSGSGLLGYGKLIIIKHNDKLLSAYAHNQAMQVKEGDSVNAGQKIATMGRDNKGQPLLHFEIRVDGSPVDPLQYLPART
jgi:lipoprotein NlpD